MTAATAEANSEKEKEAAAQIRAMGAKIIAEKAEAAQQYILSRKESRERMLCDMKAGAEKNIDAAARYIYERIMGGYGDR